QQPMPGHKNMDTNPHGWEVEYRHFTINGRCLGHGEPIRVKEGQTVLFHFLNASATNSVRFALPGHRFQVVALDGNPVPHPHLVDVLELGTAERMAGQSVCCRSRREHLPAGQRAWESWSNTLTAAASPAG